MSETNNLVDMHPGELANLVRQMARAYREMMRWQQQQMGLTLEEADAKARDPGPAEYQQRAMSDPADQISWWQLETLSDQNPEVALQAWQRIKLEARDELESGSRAASVVVCYETPWDRARFLAVRAAFLEGWLPASPLEQRLIDMLAQAYTEWERWLELYVQRASGQACVERSQMARDGNWQPPRQSTADAIDESARMADRFNRLFMRTLRALRDLRRYTPNVLIRSAGQVNIAAAGGQQVNLSRDAGECDCANEVDDRLIT